MAPEQGLICAGFGARDAGPPEDLERSLELALCAAGLTRAALRTLCAPDFKQPRIAHFAQTLGLPLVLVSQEELRQGPLPTLTHSARVIERHGVGSIAEACALLGARRLGPAGALRLLGPRASAASATCALAISEG